MLEKINDARIDWADDARVALAFKVNGRAVINCFPQGILLPTGQRTMLCDEFRECRFSSEFIQPHLSELTVENEEPETCEI